MKSNIVLSTLTVLILLFFSCRTNAPGSGPSLTDDDPVRAFYLDLAMWPQGEGELKGPYIDGLMANIGAAHFNLVLLANPGTPASVDEAIAAAHRHGLKLYAQVALPPGSDASTLARDKTASKQIVRDLVSAHNIDGLFIRISDQSLDLLEDIVVEAMVLKPYLVMAMVYADDWAQQKALQCLNLGIADLVIALHNTHSAVASAQESLWQTKVALPATLKKTSPEQALSLDLSAYLLYPPAAQLVKANGVEKITDSMGRIGIISSRPGKIVLETSKGALTLSNANWSIPYKFALLANGQAVRQGPWLEFRRRPATITNRHSFDLLCKTSYPAAAVSINGQAVKQYTTGIFFNRVTFQAGANRVRAAVLNNDGSTTFYEQEYFYQALDTSRQPFPLWINSKSLSPAMDLALLSTDTVRFSFQGSKGQNAYIVFNPGARRFICQRSDHDDYSLYSADIPMDQLGDSSPLQLTLHLEAADRTGNHKPHQLRLQQSLTLKEPSDFPMVQITQNNARLLYNLGEPRLGGPIRAELGPGVILKTNGKFGEHYRIRLSAVEHGYIHQSEVKVLPPPSIQPRFYISSMGIRPSDGFDQVSIPYLEPVPYEIYPDPHNKRLIITLFGAESSSTWVSHSNGRRMIDNVTWQQTTPETFQAYVNLKDAPMWGYDLKVEGRRLVLRIKHPLALNPTTSRPLGGLVVAIEAGHGGSNTGAIGLSGLLEKDINLDLSFRLGKILEGLGAKIVQIRSTDIEMTLNAKRDLAHASGAHLLISIHANASGGGYLQTAGASTYWHNPFWAPLATRVYDRLLELGLAEFGVVGSFNYTVTRTSQLPAVLVEQAFMTHAEDEEKLADPNFRQQMAVKISAGLVDYVQQLAKQ
jgi:N-acetylmuramoyl-L-alanine amidase